MSNEKMVNIDEIEPIEFYKLFAEHSKDAYKEFVEKLGALDVKYHGHGELYWGFFSQLIGNMMDIDPHKVLKQLTKAEAKRVQNETT